MGVLSRLGPAAALLPALLLPAGCATLTGSHHYAVGTAALDRGEPEEAVDDLEQAARLLPESSEVQNHLGIAYEASGRKDAALAAYERAVALDCSNEAAARNLRDVRASRGTTTTELRP